MNDEALPAAEDESGVSRWFLLARMLVKGIAVSNFAGMIAMKGRCPQNTSVHPSKMSVYFSSSSQPPDKSRQVQTTVKY
jgi:hypothetical protein